MTFEKIYTSLQDVNQDLSGTNIYCQLASSAMTGALLFGRTLSFMSPLGGAIYSVVQLGALKIGVRLFCTAEKVDGTWNNILVIIKAVIIPSGISYVIVAAFTPVSVISLVAVPLTTFLLAHLANHTIEARRLRELANFIREMQISTSNIVDENFVIELIVAEFDRTYPLDYIFKTGVYEGRTKRELFTDALDENKVFQKFLKLCTQDDTPESKARLNKINNELLPTIRNILNKK